MSFLILHLLDGNATRHNSLKTSPEAAFLSQIKAQVAQLHRGFSSHLDRLHLSKSFSLRATVAMTKEEEELGNTQDHFSNDIPPSARQLTTDSLGRRDTADLGTDQEHARARSPSQVAPKLLWVGNTLLVAAQGHVLIADAQEKRGTYAGCRS